MQTEGPAKVGLAAVDHSVFILAENRLNLEQVFAELERLYMQPQAELHEARVDGRPPGDPRSQRDLPRRGPDRAHQQEVPEGKEFEQPGMMVGWPAGRWRAPRRFDGRRRGHVATAMGGHRRRPTVVRAGLAEVQRVRQFFPETWIWDETITDDAGKATLTYEAPDTITTWMLRAVALSQEKGLGIAEA